MTVIIDKKIKGYSVLPQSGTEPAPTAPPENKVIYMHEGIERPDVLLGMTYKVQSPLVEHALYITINDIVLNRGTEHELRRPFEIFINSKSMEHFQWIVAITRILSAVFRKGGDVAFLIDEMRSVFDPKGGYYKKSKYMPSVVAEIGEIIEEHLIAIGYYVPEDKGAAARAMLEEKLASTTVATITPNAPDVHGFPETATMCSKCNTKAMVIMDGCATCLNCGHSKCG